MYHTFIFSGYPSIHLALSLSLSCLKIVWCSLKCIHLCKRALSSSLSQYNSARPVSERYGAAAHTGYSRAALAGDSNDQAAMSVPDRVENYYLYYSA